MQEESKRYTIADARMHFTDILNQAAYAKDRIEILRRNKPIAYIVPLEDIELLERIEDMIDEREAQKRALESTISLKDLKEDLGI